MPIPGIPQPACLVVGDGLRLRAYDGRFDFALEWYQDPELLYLVDGDTDPYDAERLRRMYEYLNAHGELYFIEVRTGGDWRPIGDVTFWREDIPIVIGERTFRRRGTGRSVISRLTERARELGYREIFVREIYSYNTGSMRAFSAAGFAPYKTTARGSTWRKIFTESGENEMEQDERFMREAIALSKAAVEHGNEPFGAVLVKDGEVVYTNENQIYTMHDPTFHAEAGLIRRFCAETGITDLSEYTMYSSCEPCFMCCGAMVWTKLGRLVYGASDRELCALLGVEGADCCALVFSLSGSSVDVRGGVLREESLEVLRSYFRGHKKG